MCNRKIKKLLIVVLLIMLLTSCVNKPSVQTEEVTTTVSEETVAEEKSDFSGKTASDMSENEILEMGDNLALEFQRIGSNYFSVLMYDHVIAEENKNKDINYPYICKLPEYKDLDELFADVYSCMTPDVLENSLDGKDFYAEYDGKIYCKERNSGWVYTADCVINGYEIIDENTIEFSLWIKEDENLDAHSSSFVVKNINGWKISEIDKETANKIIFQYSPINNELERNQSGQNISEIIENKATEINGKIAEYEIIDEENKTALALICHDNNIHDYWYFNGDSKELILSSKLNMSGYLKYEENGAVSIIAYENIVGGACPANIVAIADEKPVVLSTYSVGSETMPELYYNPFGNIICMRGNGVSSGSVNKIPYYWDEKSNSFLPYALHKIGIDELKSMDTDSIVENTEEITSVYKRDNGLIHVNYADVINADINSSITASKTYIQTENGLRNYDFEKDQGYGFFLEKLSVNE